MRSFPGKTAILLLAAVRLAGAQQIRGVVRDSAAGNALSGVVVTALDSAGGNAGRAISDAAGRFAITPSGPARRLHLIRIGYRPRDVMLPGRGDAPITVAMEKLPPLLDVVRVSGSELCPGSADRGAAFQVWEQARAGLLATIVARDLKPAEATTLLYESGMSPGDERIRRQKKEIKRGQTTRPFVAAAGPSYFAEVGYMTEDASGRLFNAPDADVLLHESFAATHCFHLQAADGAHTGQIGLAFAPIRGRDTLVDVAGVIWLDAATPQLRSLDFTYTSLEPAATQAKSGGHLEFRTMANGVSFIERWHLRLVTMQVATTSSNPLRRDGRPPSRQERFDLRIVEIVEAGGIVLDAKWTDGQVFRDTPAVVAGLITRRKTNAPVGGTLVTLAGTADTAVTDATGEFEIEAVPGKYTVVAIDTALRTFIAPRTEKIGVELPRAAVASVRMEMPPLGDAVNDICRGDRVRDSSAILVGHVWRPDAPPLRNARVHASWQDDITKEAISGLRVSTRESDTELDEQGRFVVCGVARERITNLQLREGNARIADTAVRVYAVGLTMTVDWRIGARPTMLAPMTTTAEAVSPEIRAFNERRLKGIGTFIGDSLLRRHDAQRLDVVLQNYAPDLRILHDISGRMFVVAPSQSRRTRSAFFNVSRCFSTLYVDGDLKWDPEQSSANIPFDISVIPVNRVAGVEYYAPFAPTPPQFKRSQCGTILIWTRTP